MIHGILNGMVGLAIALVGGFYGDDMPGVAKVVLFVCAAFIIGREVWVDLRRKEWQIK